jgi:hypothetical protein
MQGACGFCCGGWPTFHELLETTTTEAALSAVEGWGSHSWERFRRFLAKGGPAPSIPVGHIFLWKISSSAMISTGLRPAPRGISDIRLGRGSQ